MVYNHTDIILTPWRKGLTNFTDVTSATIEISVHNMQSITHPAYFTEEVDTVKINF